ncbi:MAG: UbiA family prenyltransferase [Saprospiraceae bacterium]|nr:UbiA family prenyltransferase [Saprospiraceae bacterium]
MKSVITCDLEGVINTYNEGAQQLFKYEPEELIGVKRVSLFSPGEIVLQNVETWLQKAREEGEYETETIFVDKYGETFPAKIRITPTYEKGKSEGITGYCGVTEKLDRPVDVPIHFTTKLISALVITRMPFVSASLLPVVIGSIFAAFGAYYGVTAGFDWSVFWLTFLGVMLLHLGSNVMNDYFDVKSGTDQANTKYFQKYSGGSRAIELGLITLEGTKRLGLTLLTAALVVGIFLTWQIGWGVLWIGLAGLAIGYFYTAPPVRLVARKGLGELAIMLSYGPLITMGTYYVLTGIYSWEAFLIGIPSGLMTANILLINEFPDMEGDAVTGKNHLVVTFGKRKSINLYIGILTLAVLSSAFLAFYLDNLLILVPSVTIAVLGAFIVKHIRQNYNKRELVKSNVNTINLQVLFSTLLALALWLNTYFA